MDVRATRRKAPRTFATALADSTAIDRFVFAQSQPQLYAWVARAIPSFFARVGNAAGGWTRCVASMWVEPDLHAPSGESILRQLLFGVAYCREASGVVPTIAWLPDTFGFPHTLPTLLAHAGMHYFATTKLRWNETTRWPYPQFRWYGDDGSAVLAASVERQRRRAATLRA